MKTITGTPAECAGRVDWTAVNGDADPSSFTDDDIRFGCLAYGLEHAAQALDRLATDLEPSGSLDVPGLRRAAAVVRGMGRERG